MEWQFLVNCADDFEAGLVMGALEDKGIRTMKSYRGSGDYMRVIGGVGKDVDVYVPQAQYETAREILQDLITEAEEEPEEPAPEEEEPAPEGEPE